MSTKDKLNHGKLLLRSTILISTNIFIFLNRLALPEELTINENSSDENDCSSNNSEFQPTKISFDTKKPKCSKYRKVSYNNNTTANVSWSHISTPDSLEWDVDPGDLDDDDSIDQDTKDLLNEIELLKNTVLNETGDTMRLDNEAES